MEEQRGGLQAMKEGGRRMLDFGSTSAIPESVKGLGEAALGAVQYVTSPATALVRGIVGEPVRPMAERTALTLGASPETARTAGEFTRNLAETAAGFAVPEMRLPGLGPRAPKVVEPPVMKAETVLSKGQATGDPVQLAWENRARHGLEGEQAQKDVQAFDRYQEAQAAERRQAVQRSFDPQRREQPVLPTPREAGEIAQQAVQRQAEQADQLTDKLFTQARGYDTQVEAGIFRGMGSAIRRDIYAGTDPVIVDRALTPSANAMIADLNSQPEALARRLGQKIPEGEKIAALPLEMVDRIRRRLLGLRRGAAAAARGGRYEDLRASQAVIDAFDNRIDQAIDRGLFSGDPQGIQAWKDARAAHAGYREQFSRFSRDPTSKTIEKVIGGGAAEPLIPEKVAEHIYGANIIKPTTDNVAAARRFKTMLDPEQWGAVQTAHFEKLNEAADHLKAADNIDTFLDHSMADVMYTPAQRDMLRAYADLRRSLGSKATLGAPTQVRTMADRISQRMAGWIGAGFGRAIGGTLGTFVGHPIIGAEVGGALGRAAAERAAAALPGARAARRVQRDMRIINNAWVDYAAAVQAYEKNNTARNVARLTLAVRNLDRNLKTIGSSFQDMQGGQQGGQAPQQPPQPPGPAPRPTITVPLPPGVMGRGALPAPLSGGAGAE
jgi:hypothetical protein